MLTVFFFARRCSRRPSATLARSRCFDTAAAALLPAESKSGCVVRGRNSASAVIFLFPPLPPPLIIINRKRRAQFFAGTLFFLRLSTDNDNVLLYIFNVGLLWSCVDVLAAAATGVQCAARRFFGAVT